MKRYVFNKKVRTPPFLSGVQLVINAFSLYANDVWLHPNVNLPLPDEDILFSFEVNPSFLYAKVQRLPFGCHAFEKFEFDSFWSQYISLL